MRAVTVYAVRAAVVPDASPGALRQWTNRLGMEVKRYAVGEEEIGMQQQLR